MFSLVKFLGIVFFSEHQNKPLIIVNLSTLSYHFELNNKDMLCGYQLNKIKFELENFLSQMKNTGGELEFVFKKIVADDKDFLRRRLRDYRMGCEIIKAIKKEPTLEKLLRTFDKEENIPYNTLILVALIQSAQKFGTVHGCNTLKGKPTVQQIELARQKDAAWILGLDTKYFIMPGKWKIWCDSKLNMQDMTVQELDPNIVMGHFELQPEQGPLFACLIGDLESCSSRVTGTVSQYFDKPVFEKAAKFIRRLQATTTDEMIQETVDKIFGSKSDHTINEDFKKSLRSYEINDEVISKVDIEILDIVKDDFMSIAEEILLNMPIFIFPAYLDFSKTDMTSINDLVLPIIQKTAGILLKNVEDSEPRKLILLRGHDKDFTTELIQICVPDFEVPSLKTIFAGEMLEKMEILCWISGIHFQNFEMMLIPQEYQVDCIILLYALKHNSIKLIDARCILKTLVDARRRAVPLECSTEYPETVNERAFRCSFLYSKLYFFFHSCLSSIGMKHLCPDIEFDGVYFQKIYALNVQQEEEEGRKQSHAKESSDNINDVNIEAGYPEGDDLDQAEIIDEFSTIIRM